jgi:hypothetical protein
MPFPPPLHLIDRTPQNIPLPLGGMAPVRVRRSARTRAIRTRAHVVTAGAAVCCAAAGVTLLAAPTTVPAALLGGRIEVGSMSLREVGAAPQTGTFLYGGDASLALTERGDGSARASAAWIADGALSSGTCDLRRDGSRLIDDCSFTGPPGTTTSVDVLDPARGAGWQRTYRDGARVTIAVPADGAAIPVPFPIGRP